MFRWAAAEELEVEMAFLNCPTPPFTLLFLFEELD
jgi:hypothetical protein